MEHPTILNEILRSGYDDWRLPSIEELATLINYGKHAPPASDFPDMPSKVFWSSSSYTYYASFAWGVNFNFGSVNDYGKSSTAYVHCVRGGA